MPDLNNLLAECAQRHHDHLCPRLVLGVRMGLYAAERASIYAPTAPDRWHAQLAAYQIMPVPELLRVQPVKLTLSLQAITSHHGNRKVCDCCGEDIINERKSNAASSSSVALARVRHTMIRLQDPFLL